MKTVKNYLNLVSFIVFFYKVNPKLISDNKNCWRIIKPSFSGKCNFPKKIIISEKDFIVSDIGGLCEVFNEHLLNVTKTLDLKPSFISTSKSLHKIIEFLKIIPALKFFLCRGRRVSVQVLFCNSNDVKKVILIMDEKRRT